MLGVVALDHGRASRDTQAVPQLGVQDKAADSGGQGRRITDGKPQSIVIVAEQLGRTTRSCDDHRSATGHGLDDR